MDLCDLLERLFGKQFSLQLDLEERLAAALQDAGRAKEVLRSKSRILSLQKKGIGNIRRPKGLGQTMSCTFDCFVSFISTSTFFSSGSEQERVELSQQVKRTILKICDIGALCRIFLVVQSSVGRI